MPARFQPSWRKVLGFDFGAGLWKRRNKYFPMPDVKGWPLRPKLVPMLAIGCRRLGEPDFASTLRRR
jgi:hypothetical protein